MRCGDGASARAPGATAVTVESSCCVSRSATRCGAARPACAREREVRWARRVGARESCAAGRGRRLHLQVGGEGDAALAQEGLCVPREDVLGREARQAVQQLAPAAVQAQALGVSQLSLKHRAAGRAESHHVRVEAAARLANRHNGHEVNTHNVGSAADVGERRRARLLNRGAVRVGAQVPDKRLHGARGRSVVRRGRSETLTTSVGQVDRRCLPRDVNCQPSSE